MEGDGYCIIEKVEASNGKGRILESMVLDFPVNSVTAILGPSGSGKTTLLSVLTDSVPSNIQARANVFLPGLSAFIPQEDCLHGFYTPRSYLWHYARLSGMANKGDIVGRIDTLLTKLGLIDQANTIVGDVFFKGLSGGQQRRLSLALEALSEPVNLFLDEPTSGLDAESALQVMEFLKDYASGAPGRRVILTIHQPSSFIWQTIEHAILLSKGKLMYNGPRSQMESFFSDQGFPTQDGWNCADHYIVAVNDEFRDHDLSVDEWAVRFQKWSREPGSRTKTSNHGQGSSEKASRASLKYGKGSSHTSRSTSPLVIIELTHRYFLNLFFNPGILASRMAMYTMLALMVGALFWDLGDRHDFESIQSRIAVLFYCVSFFIFMSVAILPFTVMERAIVDKEVRNQYYNPLYYQISQAISSIPGCALLALLVSVLICTMVKFNDPLWYFLTMFLSLLVAEALALCVSHIAPHFIIGIAVVAGMYGFFMLYMGFMIIPSDFPDWLGWLYYVAFHTYSWRTFMVSEFRNEPEFTGGVFANGNAVLAFYEIDDVDRSNDMIVLVGYCFALHLLGGVFLYLRYHLFDGKVLPVTGGKDSLHSKYSEHNKDSTHSRASSGGKVLEQRKDLTTTGDKAGPQNAISDPLQSAQQSRVTSAPDKDRLEL